MAAEFFTASDGSTWVWNGERDEGQRVVYQLRDNLSCADCSSCVAGKCVQRVRRSDAWEFDHIIHAEQAELS